MVCIVLKAQNFQHDMLLNRAPDLTGVYILSHHTCCFCCIRGEKADGKYTSRPRPLAAFWPPASARSAAEPAAIGYCKRTQPALAQATRQHQGFIWGMTPGAYIVSHEPEHLALAPACSAAAAAAIASGKC